jgi:hypothetical protein
VLNPNFTGAPPTYVIALHWLWGRWSRCGRSRFININFPGIFINFNFDIHGAAVILAGADTQVLLQAGPHREPLVTLVTAVGTLAGVRPLVCCQVGARSEPLVTLVTAVRTLSGVRPLVFCQVGARSEPLVALVTAVGPLTGVCPLVSRQV